MKITLKICKEIVIQIWENLKQILSVLNYHLFDILHKQKCLNRSHARFYRNKPAYKQRCLKWSNALVVLVDMFILTHSQLKLSFKNVTFLFHLHRIEDNNTRLLLWYYSLIVCFNVYYRGPTNELSSHDINVSNTHN